jgi:Flp pilus assembly protein TadD
MSTPPTDPTGSRTPVLGRPDRPPADTELLVEFCRRWQEARQGGTAAAPAELCGDRPDLLPDLLRAIDVLGVVGGEATLASDEVPADGDPFAPRLPGYEILGELGRGGMGVVYKARQLALNRTVAVKVILDPDAASPARLVRFRQEAEVVARLQHPNVVQIFETGVAGGRPFLALEYVDGGTLKQRTAGVPLPPRDAARLIETVARAVHHAHEVRIIHRDLKPHNVLLTAGGVPKVADFGLARSLDVTDGLTLTADFLGTPAYAAPEQVQGRAADLGPWTDVHALGATLYELLAGRAPFQAESVRELLRQVTDRDPAPLRRLRPGCPRDLATVCEKCLRKEPGRRYASAAALADDLARFLAGEPVRARPVGPAGRVRRWAGRNPAVAGLLAAVGALLLAAAAGGAALSVSLLAALRDAERDRDRAADAEREGRGRLAAERAAAARLALQRGDGRAALRLLDEAAAAGSDTPAARLERVKALCTVHEIPRAVREARDLAGRPDLGDRQGEALLWQADLEMDHGSMPPADGLRQVRRAVEAGLPAADAHYARGLLADATPAALDHFRRAVDADPANPRANGMLVTLLVVSGRFPEARDRLAAAEALFPENPAFRVLHAELDALAGRPDAAAAQLRLARGRLTDGAFAAAEAVVRFCPELVRFGHDLERLICGDPTAGAVGISVGFAVTLLNAQAVLGRQAGELYLPAPPVLVTAARRLPGVLPLFAGNARAADAMERFAEAHPDGFLYLWIGALRANEDTHDGWARAEQAFLRAAAAPALVPVRRPALFGAAAAGQFLHDDAPAAERPARRRQVLDRIAAVLDLGPLAEQGHILTQIALNVGAPPELRWRAFRAWEAAAPADPRLPRFRAKLLFEDGAYGWVIRLADEAARDGRDDPNWRALRSAAAARLKLEADQLASGDGDRKRP